MSAVKFDREGVRVVVELMQFQAQRLAAARRPEEIRLEALTLRYLAAWAKEAIIAGALDSVRLSGL